MLRKVIYPKVESLLNTVALKLHEQGFTPNQLTLAGAGFNFLAGIFYANGLLFWGALIMLLAGAGDALDGPVARVSKTASPFGAFLDSTVDRYSDFFLFGGLAMHFAKTDQGVYFLITMGTLLGAYVTSYSKARAENIIEDCSVGVFERTERIIALAIATGIPFLLSPILWILFLGTQVTALQRILHTNKALSESE